MKQQISGLGVEAQREIIHNHVKNKPILAEYIETESGKKSNRPQLLAALAMCRKTNSILIVAKLDRLSRNVAFTSKLLESDVEIVFCDFPQANRLILHIISSIAEYEAGLISQRTKQSLQAKLEGKRVPGLPYLRNGKPNSIQSPRHQLRNLRAGGPFQIGKRSQQDSADHAESAHLAQGLPKCPDICFFGAGEHIEAGNNSNTRTLFKHPILPSRTDILFILTKIPGRAQKAQPGKCRRALFIFARSTHWVHVCGNSDGPANIAGQRTAQIHKGL